MTIHGPWYMTLKQVVRLLEEHKFVTPISAKHASLAVPNWNPNKAMPQAFQILAVDGRSCYDMGAESGLLIHRDEPIGRFTDTLRRLRIHCQEGKVVATSFPAQLEITFNRTLRLPEDGKIHNLPSDVGHIPVTNIALHCGEGAEVGQGQPEGHGPQRWSVLSAVSTRGNVYVVQSHKR